MITKMIFDIARKAYTIFERTHFKQHRSNILRQIKGGANLYLDGTIKIIVPNNLSLGNNVYIGANAYLNCLGGIRIGNHTILSRNVTIYSYNHNFKCPEQLPYDSRLILEPVYIGDYVWIGMNATIAPGSVIGDGAVIGMGTVVSGSIPENAIVVNSKPRIVGYRDSGLTKNLADKAAFLRANDYNN